MFSETTKKLLDAARQIRDLKDEQKKLAEGKKKVQPMEKIHYRFPAKTKSECAKLAKSLSFDGFDYSESEVARAALHIGLQELERVKQKDKRCAQSLMKIIGMRHKLFG